MQLLALLIILLIAVIGVVFLLILYCMIHNGIFPSSRKQSAQETVQLNYSFPRTNMICDQNESIVPVPTRCDELYPPKLPPIGFGYTTVEEEEYSDTVKIPLPITAEEDVEIKKLSYQQKNILPYSLPLSTTSYPTVQNSYDHEISSTNPAALNYYR